MVHGENNKRGMAKQYNQIAAQTDMHAASPYRIIQMLMQGALDRISVAKGLMREKNYGKMGQQISLAISIIDNLRVSLDHSINRDLTEALETLYDYMMLKLFEANVKKDEALLDEVAGLIKEIKSGWDEIPEEHRNAHSNAEKYLKNHDGE